MDSVFSFSIPTHFGDLRAFCLVIDLGSISAAARQTSESKGSLSRRLTRLEKDIGVTLLHRTTRAVQPTEFGRTYHHFAQQALKSLARGSAAIQQDLAPGGHMRVAASSGFAVAILAPLLRPFTKQFPHIKLELILTDEAPNFSAQQLDAAIYPARKLADSSLMAKRLLEWEATLVASADYLKLRGTPTRPEDLAQHNVILGSGPNRSNSRVFRIITQRHGAVQVAVPNATVTTNTLFAREVALSGGGVALVPNFLVEKDLRLGRLLELFPGSRFNSRPGGLYLLYPSATFISPKVQVLRDFLSQAMTAVPPTGL